MHDDEKPIADIISPTGGVYTTSLPFQLVFTDNKNLFQYRLAISYTGIYDSNDSSVVSPFNYYWVDNITNSEFNKTLNVTIPDSVIPGQYRAVLTCVDESGLESKPDTAIFYIKNLQDSIGPTININSPISGSNYTDSLNILANIFDNTKVIYYHIELKDELGTLKKQVIKYINTDSYPLDEIVTVSDITPGNYSLILTVRDAYYNTNSTTIPIIIN